MKICIWTNMIINNRNVYNNFLKKYKGCFSLQKYNYFLKINKVEERLNFEEYFLPNVKHNDLKILFFIDFDKFIKNKNWYFVLNEKYMEIVLKFFIKNNLKLKRIYIEQEDIYSIILKKILKTNNVQLINRMSRLKSYQCKNCNKYYDIYYARQLKCLKCDSIKCYVCQELFFQKKVLVEHIHKIHKEKYLKNRNVEIYCIKCKSRLMYNEKKGKPNILHCENKNCFYSLELKKKKLESFKKTIKTRDASTISKNYKKAALIRENIFKNTIEENGLTKKENIMNKTKEKISLILKEKIKRGEYTPCVTNSWANSKCVYKDKKFRSSWELFFYIFNEKKLNILLNYEKTRVEYFYKNQNHNYIIDFDFGKNLYEVKPNSLKDNERNSIKIKTAKKWALKNGYKYHIITEKWFKKNIISIDLLVEQLKLDFDEKTYIKLKKAIKGFKK